MCPKFRGNSEDWLDNEKLARKLTSKNKKKSKPEQKEIPFEESNALVIEVFPNQCKVLTDTNEKILCQYRRSVFQTKELKERSPVTVGDRVLINLVSPQSGVIEALSTRKNRLFRQAPDRGKNEIHVLAANIDLLAIVASTQTPDFSPGLVDRFLVAAQHEKIPTILCVNKSDLIHTPETRPWDVYSELKIPILEISAKNGIGIPSLLKQITGKTVVFCGHSGVGKTSLLQKLLEKEIGAIGEVNATTGKGRHTTTGGVVLEGPENSYWIDTPGIREFGLSGLEPHSLTDYFPEFLELGCTQRGCIHINTSECEAIGLTRYQSYFNIYKSL